MAKNHAFSLTGIFIMVAVEIIVFGTLGFDAIPALTL